MIEISNLQKRFGDKIAVDIEQFTINRGEILGLVGNNGAGKTSLFRLILDLLKADSGSVLFKETINPATSEDWKDFTGAFINDGFLIDFLTPEEYFEFIAKISGVSKNELNDRLTVYEQFMSGEILGQKKLIRNLSAGNKQKVGIISALISRPELVVLDEPFNFLDPSSQMILKQLLVNYREETDATILVSSHNLDHTIDISTRIALMEHGKIVKNLSNKGLSAKEEIESYFKTV